MPYVDDFVSPWQYDAGDESLMTPLKPAVIPTVVESEHVTDDDDEWRRLDTLPAAAAAAVHQCSVDDRHAAHTQCHIPLTVAHQGTRLRLHSLTAALY